MKDCLFCKIIAGEIPSTKIYEDTHVFAFLDITPINSGHTLVIPKEHYTDIYDTPDKILEYMMSAIRKISSALKKSLKTNGVNIYMNNGTGAGQVVFHVHIHVIPRFKGDGRELWHGKPELASENEKIGDKIKNAL